LYRDRLKKPLEAAACLQNGGLWAEALELYRQLGEFEKAGDLARAMISGKDNDRFACDVRWYHAGNGHIAPCQLFEASQTPRRLGEMVQVLLRLHGEVGIERLNLGDRGFK
jgi:hypothetical protein